MRSEKGDKDGEGCGNKVECLEKRASGAIITHLSVKRCRGRVGSGLLQPFQKVELASGRREVDTVQSKQQLWRTLRHAVLDALAENG